MDHYDIAIIGGGPAGYVAAIRAAQYGAKTVLFEKDKLGGTCLNRGCIPMKTYLKTAEWIEAIRDAHLRGIMINDAGVRMDMKKALEEKEKVSATLRNGIGSLLKANGVEVIPAAAVIGEDRSIEAEGKKYFAENIIIASGSMAGKPPIPGAENERVVTSDEMLLLDYVPEKLIIVGGGVIGLEIAFAYQAFGSDVTIVELEARMLPTLDAEISREMTKHIRTRNIKTYNGVKVERFEEAKEGISAHLSNGEKLDASIALISIGRKPYTEGISIMPLAMEKGFIKTDDYFETSEKGIYAIGDVNGKMMLAHAGSKMGEAVIDNILKTKNPVQFSHIPACVYTHPEIGSVGLTEEQAKAGYDVLIGRFYFGANGRALASGAGAGFVKVIAKKSTGEILGVHIAGPNATEMANEAAAYMCSEATVYEMAETVHAHPTFSEALMEAAADALGRCIHGRPKK